MRGLHLTADLSGCPSDLPVMTDVQALRSLCLAAVRAVGLQPVGELFHRFAPTPPGPGGITGVVLLAESHLAVHTWPELSAVTLDAYVCNRGQDNRAKAQALVDRLCQAFAPQHADRQRLERGRPYTARP